MGNTERTAAAAVRRVVWTEPARADLENILAYIGQFNPLAAQRLALRIIAATDKVVALFPHAGRAIGGGRYEFPIVWPYALRYKVEDDEVIILRVRHGARQTDD